MADDNREILKQLKNISQSLSNIEKGKNRLASKDFSVAQAQSDRDDRLAKRQVSEVEKAEIMSKLMEQYERLQKTQEETLKVWEKQRNDRTISTNQAHKLAETSEAMHAIQEAMKNIDASLEVVSETQLKINKLQDDLSKTDDEAKKQEIEEELKGLEKLLEKEREKSDKDKSDANKKLLEGVGEKVEKAFSMLSDFMDNAMDRALSLQGQYFSAINTRLMGLDSNDKIYYKAMLNQMDTFTTSQYVSMQKLMTNVAKLAEDGIAYNLEERALLETIKDKMVTTFSTMEGQLDRLIRIQQADLSRQQMGAEIELNKMLNSMFKDTSYLSKMYDSVSSALIDATALTNYEGAVGINFAVQKWLGSLYSVGMSEAAVGNIASGLTALATGNTENITGTPMGNLFALSARNAGLDYAEMLNQGLNSSNINDLMKSMVEYLQQISTSLTGNVARSQMLSNFGGGLSFSDIRAIQNLTASDIRSIYGNNQDYISTSNIFQNQLNSLEKRTSGAERINNLTDNIVMALGIELTNGDQDGFGNILSKKLADNIPKMLEPFIGSGASRLLSGIADASWVIGNLLSDNVGDWIYDIGISIGQSKSWESGSIGAYISALESSGHTSALAERGNYVPMISGAVTSGTSHSYSSSGSSPFNRTTAATTTTGTVANQTISELYNALFEDQSKPIRVSIAKLEPQAQDDFGIDSNGLKVDVQDNDINSLIDTIYSVRMSR